MSDWFEAEVRAERAQRLCESHRWAEALTEIDAAVSINPNNATWQAQRGFVLEELGRFDEAAEAYEESLELEAGDGDVMLALGSVLLRLERFAQALSVLDELARLYPDCEAAYCHRIHALAELGQHERAEEMFYLAQQINDDCPHCFYAMGVSLFARGQRDKAIYCWKRVIQLEPDYYGVNLRIAEAYRAAGDFTRARKYLLQELRGDAGNTELLYELAQLTWESGDAAGAVAKFAHIIELDPTHYDSHYALGRLWLEMGQPKRAVSCFGEVVRVVDPDPGLVGFHKAYGQALLLIGNYSEAWPRLRHAMKEDPSDPDVAMSLGDCLLGQERAGDASEWYRQALSLDSSNATAYYKLGLCHFKQERHEAGLAQCLNAIEHKPDYVPAMYNAAVAQLHIGQWKASRNMLRRALAIDPTHTPSAELLRKLWRFRIRHALRRAARLLLRIAGRRV